MAGLVPKVKVGVLISGRGSNLQALLEACADPDYPAEIPLVISNEPAAQGLERAEAAGVPSQVIDHRNFTSRATFEGALTAALKAYGAEMVCQAGFMRIVTAGFVERWRDRMINVHPSLLPLFPGLDTHARALAAGVKLHGCTVHFVREKVDAGPIIGQAAVPVLPGDTPESLGARVLEAEHRLYPHCLRLLAEGRVRVAGDRVEIDGLAAPDQTPGLFNPAP